MLYIVQNSTQEEYDQFVFPTLKYVVITQERESESGNGRETEREIDTFLISPFRLFLSLPSSFLSFSLSS